MKIIIITLFPEMFEALNYGVIGRGIQQKLISIDFLNPRQFTLDKHQTVDDRPYGGGPGMVMKFAPLRDAILKAKQQFIKAPVILLTPQGKLLQQNGVKQLSENKELILVCGRYEGIDQRLIEKYIDQEWSIGDYVVSGGELPAMVVTDAMARQIPGVLGHHQSASQDSFENGLLDYPHYTRPEMIEGMAVPNVLLTGDHQSIERWRHQQALDQTAKKRPDLLKRKDYESHH